MIYLHENGVTVVATNEAKRGKVYELNGEEYYIARGVSDIKRIVDSGEYPLNRVVTSKLTSFNYLFQIKAGWEQRAVPKNFNDDISNWDTSNVLSMEEVFTGWPDFNQDISNWDTSRVESMHGMFKSSKYTGNYHMGPTSFNQDISKWNVSNVKNMSEMFLGATSFNQDINSWDVSNVENMDYMFSGAISFNQPIGKWDVSNVKTMEGMFSDVTSIGILAFVGTLEYNRAGHTSFNQDIGNWDVSNVKIMSKMFSGATSFNQDISNWNVSNVESMRWMFSGGIKNGVAHTIENNPTSFNQPIGKWDVSNVKYMNFMFYNATAFNQDLSNWNVSGIGGMESMFHGAISFNQPIGSWNTSNVGSMIHMFCNAKAFNQDISNWNVSSVSFVEGMFYGATSFNSPIGKWKFKSPSSMENMFREATSFNQDISGWDVSSVIQMKGLFQDATSFNQDLRGWQLNEKLPKSRTMFAGATAFKIKEYSPFLNVKKPERKVNTSTANLSPEDKRTYSKIKKLLTVRDTDQIDLGVELAVSLNNSSIFTSILSGCKLEGETKLVTNKLFTGSGPAQPFLNYALMTLIANVPENDDIEIDHSIKIRNIEVLNLSTITFKADWNEKNECKIPDISNLTYLKTLIVKGAVPSKYKSSNLTNLTISDFTGSLEFLSEFPKLEYFELEFSSYGSDAVEGFESIKNLIHLKEFKLSSGGKVTDINFLSECKELQKLQLDISDGYGYGSQDEKINDITILKNLKNLEELSIKGIHSNLDISPIGSCENLNNLTLEGAIYDMATIGGCKNLKNLNLSFSDVSTIPDLSMISSCNELSDLSISGCAPYDINAEIESINGIRLSKNLKSINISGSYRGTGVTLSGINGGNLSSANSKSNPKIHVKDEIIKVNEEELTDEGIVTLYRGEPFTGIMYCNFENNDIVSDEYEMVKGLKHGTYKHFYVGGKFSGKLRIEHNFINDEHDKIVGFYDGAGNNYVGKNLCVGASSLKLLANDKPVFVEKFHSFFNGNEKNEKYNIERDNPTGLEHALFFHNDKVFTGQVLVHKYTSNWKPINEFNCSLYRMVYNAIEDHVPGHIPDNYISFLVAVKDGRLTGEFCASSGSKFFSGYTDEHGAQNPMSIMKVNDLSKNKSNELSLEGKSIVVTGVFENYSRNELKELIKENGGSPSSSVTSNTFLILAGDKMGPKKKILADELGIKIIDIDIFLGEYINKGSDENTENEISFIDLFYPELAAKKTISKKKLKSEDKKTFTKIKSLLQARDLDKIDMGIELMRSINILEFYEALLADCKINNEAGSQSVISNKFFKGSGPAQPYLDYALYHLIYYCPEEAEVDDSIRKKNITYLNLNSFFKRHSLKYKLPPIENFTSLNEFYISLGNFDIDNSKPTDVLKNSSVKIIRIEDSQNSLMWLKNFPQINELDILSEGYGKPSKDMKVFEYLINLEKLNLICTNSENIDFLKNCTKIKELNLVLKGRYSSPGTVKNVDVLKHLNKLQELDITVPEEAKLEGEFSYEGLSYCKNLKDLKVITDNGLAVLTNLKNCSTLERVQLQNGQGNGQNFNIKLKLSNFYGLNKSTNLKKLNLDNLTFESKSNLFIDQ